MSKSNRKQHTKKALIEALKKSLGIVSSACDKVGINRTTFYRYIEDDAEFKTEVENVSELTLDFAESKLHKLINDENVTAILFYLKTKGKKRGYIENPNIQINNKSVNKQTFKIGDQTIEF